MIQNIPSELVRIILSFYVQSWKDAIRFGSVCKTWKFEGDHSLIWLKGNLIFYAPQSYFTAMSTALGRVAGSVTSAGEIRSWTVFLFKDHVVVDHQLFLCNKYKIICIFSDEGITMQNGNTIHVSEQAYLVRQEFMRFFLDYHRLWLRYTRWINCLLPYRINISSDVTNKIVGVVFILQGIAAVLLSSIPDFPSSLSIQSHFGFICCYVAAFIYLVFAIDDIISAIVHSLKGPKDCNLNGELDFTQVWIILGMVSYLPGIMFSLVLLQCKFSLGLDGSNVLPYSYLSIPFWVFAFLSFLFEARGLYYKESTYFLVLLLIVIGVSIFPLTYTIATFYYFGSIGSLWYCLLPLIPLEGAAIYYAVLRVSSTYYLCRRFCRERFGGEMNEYHVKTLQLAWCLFKFISAWAMVGMIVYFNVGIGLNTMKLWEAFVLWIVFLMILQFHVVDQNSDSEYAWR